MHRAFAISGPAALALSAALLLASTAAQADGCQGTSCYNLVKTPPTYAEVAERKLVRKTQNRRRVVPARYTTITEKVMIQPARQIPHHVEGQYYSISEKVLIAPGGPRWEVTTDIHGRTTGCWIEDEPQYGFRQRLVESAPARIEYETIPAVYTQRQRRVLVRPSRVVNETIRAGYKTRYRKVLVSPGSEHWQRAGR